MNGQAGEAVFMKTLIITITCLVLFAPMLAEAEAISIPIDPALTGIPFLQLSPDFHFSDFNGLPVAGQSVSVDLTWADDILARVLKSGVGTAFLLNIATNTASPGFAAALTGQLLTANGGTLGAVHQLGSVQISPGGIFAVGLSVPTAETGSSFDFIGAHLEFGWPDCGGCVVTDAFVRLNVGAPATTVEFGTVAQLPDGDRWGVITVAMLILGGLVFLFRGPRSKREALVLQPVTTHFCRLDS